MNTSSVLKRLKSAELTVLNGAPSRPSFYWADASKERISFIDQAGSAICLKVTPHGDKNEPETDYHAGSYANSIKQALQWAGVAP